jgi:two-component system invasion response regulator UvrY
MVYEKIRIAIADDHIVMRNGLAELVTKLGYNVLFEGSNGREIIDRISVKNLPDIVLMDINMPEMDGFATSNWFKANYPKVKILALSTYDDEGAIIRMLKNGARGYLLKSSEADELKRAIESVHAKGFYYSEIVTGTLFRSIREDEEAGIVSNLNDREIHFLELAPTEMTYKEIAAVMHVSPRTVDGYRETLFEKLGVKSRIGLVLFAIKNRIVHVG